MINRTLFKSNKQSWETPEKIFNGLDKEFHFNDDPCPTSYCGDGLAREWGTSTFVNPPYNQIARWLQKGCHEAQKGKVVVFLIPSRTDTRWWHEFVMNAHEIRFIKGRLKFKGAKWNAPFPSCIVLFKKED